MGVRLYLSDRDAVRLRSRLDDGGDMPAVVAKLDRQIRPAEPIPGQTSIDDEVGELRDAA